MIFIKLKFKLDKIDITTQNLLEIMKPITTKLKENILKINK